MGCMVAGQVGAIQLGISRALQNWEPDLRPPLKAGTVFQKSLEFLVFSLSLVQYYFQVISPKGPFFRFGIDIFSAYPNCHALLYFAKKNLDLSFDEVLLIKSQYVFHLFISWFLDEGFACGGEEKAWKSKSKKELPVGEALRKILLHYHFVNFTYQLGVLPRIHLQCLVLNQKSNLEW